MTWLDVLLDPAPLIRAHAERGAPGDKHRIGMALLLEAKLSEYEHLARQHGLPSLTSRPEPAPDAVTGLLVALVLHLTGEQDAITRYTDLATSNAVPSDLRTVAAVLASIALSDAGDITRAASLLSDQDSAAESDLERVLLLLHRGLRQAERGDLPDAIVIMERARTLCDTPTGSDRITSALSLVAQRNAQAFRLLAHTRSLTQLIPSRTTSSILMRVDQLIGDALSSYLYNTFDTLVEDPYARTFRWTASDPVDIPLFAALLRAECLADWILLQDTRRLLGRYRILSAVGRPDAQPVGAFSLLRRSRDYQGLRRGISLYVGVGPLPPLRAFVDGIAAIPWTSFYEQVDLAVLTEAADVISPGASNAAVSRLLQDPQLLRRHVYLGIEALSQLVQVANDNMQQAVATELRRMAEQSPDEIGLVQTIARGLAAIRWSAVTRDERASWLNMIRREITTERGHLLAGAAAVALSSVEQDAIKHALLDAFEAQPALHLGALLLDAKVELEPDVASRIVGLACDVLTAVRAEAARGSYGIGLTDAALLLASLVTRYPIRGWDELMQFLLDRRAAASEKTQALEFLAEHVDRIPSTAVEMLRLRWPELLPSEVPILDDRDAFAGSTLRLALALNVLSSGDLWAMLVGLASARSDGARIQAARTVVVAERSVAPEALVTLALSLTHDRNHNVRSEAGRALALVASLASTGLAATVESRLNDLLHEAGAIVPRFALLGLAESAKRGVRPPAQLLAAVSDLHNRHLAASVRWAAGHVLKVVVAEGAR